MDANRFDRISKLFARRHALAQEATPAPDQPARAPELLFVQAFRAGAIAPKAGTNGRYTLALEGGSDQTIFFSERPDRIVGTTPTATIANRIGFPDDDPPNAALVVETAPGETDVAVVELFSPVYDEGTGSIAYEIEVLQNWQAELEMGFGETPTDLAELVPAFGAAHLFIDGAFDCPGGNIQCVSRTWKKVIGEIPESEFDGKCSTYGAGFTKWASPSACLPCSTMNQVKAGEARISAELANNLWTDVCNQRFKDCLDPLGRPDCRAANYCMWDGPFSDVCPAGSGQFRP
jgi:hypothetical protein